MEETNQEEIFDAQKQLGHVIERAQIGEEKDFARTIREKGEAFISLLYGTMKMTRLYERNNETFKRPIEELVDQIAFLMQHLGTIHLVTVEEQVYINDVRIRFNTAKESARELGAMLRQHNVGGITFHQPLTCEAMLDLLIVLAAESKKAKKRRSNLLKRLKLRKIKGIELSGVNRYLLKSEEELLSEEEGEWHVLIEKILNLVEENWNNAAAKRAINPLALRRVVVELLTAGIYSEALWGAFPLSSEHASHALRVCRLCLVIADQIGLSDKAKQDLGVTALIHDIGYIYHEGASANSFGDHIRNGALIMLRQKGFHDAKIQRMLGTLYHHHDYKAVKDLPSLFARIIKLADDYDNYCRESAGGLSPAAALAKMGSGAGVIYDPSLFQAMVNILGCYPPGTRLRLADGRVVTCLSLVREKNFDKPRVKRSDGRVVELAACTSVKEILSLDE